MNQTNKQVFKLALITGAARRIGAAIARKLHSAQYKVLIHCQNSESQAKELAATLNKISPDSALVFQQDLCASNAATNLIEAAIAWTGRLDVLVNNASIFSRSDLSGFNQTHWDNLFKTNVQAPYLLSLAARPYLRLQQGVIINLTDINGEMPLKNYAEYCQTKAALVMQTKTLALEFAPEIRVNAVAPGAIAWPEKENQLSKEDQAKIIAKTPLKKHGDPLQIAQAVFALIENQFITGQILKVDGGRSL